MSVPQNAFPFLGNGTYFLFTNCTYWRQVVGGACPKWANEIGDGERPSSVQLGALRRLAVSDWRVGFMPATCNPSITRLAVGQPSDWPRSGRPPLNWGSYFFNPERNA